MSRSSAVWARTGAVAFASLELLASAWPLSCTTSSPGGQDGRMATGPVMLRNYRYAPRKARVEIRGDELELFLPPYFGRRRWSVPIGNTAVTDLTSVQDTSSREDLYPDGISIPYFFTAGPATSPTILLLFRQPTRVPPLRALTAYAPNVDLPFGYFQTRSAKGAFVDGPLLRAVDPPSAAQQLVAAGVERVDDPSRWLRSHRRTLTDPGERAQLFSQIRATTRLSRVAAALFYGPLLVGPWALSRPSTPWWISALLVLVLAVGLLFRFLARQPLRQRPP